MFVMVVHSLDNFGKRLSKQALKPVYEIGSVPLKEIDSNAALNESLVRDYVKEELSEWMLANDDNLMLNKDDGMEEPYRKKISDYLKAMGILDG